MQISRHTSIVVLLELTDFYYFMTIEMLTTIELFQAKNTMYAFVIREILIVTLGKTYYLKEKYKIDCK